MSNETRNTAAEEMSTTLPIAMEDELSDDELENVVGGVVGGDEDPLIP